MKSLTEIFQAFSKKKIDDRKEWLTNFMEDRRQRRLHGLPEVSQTEWWSGGRKKETKIDVIIMTILLYNFSLSNFYMVQQQSIWRTMISSTRNWFSSQTQTMKDLYHLLLMVSNFHLKMFFIHILISCTLRYPYNKF